MDAPMHAEEIVFQFPYQLWLVILSLYESDAVILHASAHPDSTLTAEEIGEET